MNEDDTKAIEKAYNDGKLAGYALAMEEAKVLVEALEFYGDEKSWVVSSENEYSKVKRTIIKKENDCESFGYQASPEDKNIVVTIAGNLARQALKEFKERSE